MWYEEGNPSKSVEEGSDWALSVCMLQSVLNGSTYEVVAKRFNLSRTAVERRIKRVASHVAALGGIEGLNLEGAATVRRLRMYRDAVLRVVASMESPPGGRSPRQHRILTEEEVITGCKRIQSKSPSPLEDSALFLMLFATGARPLEIARLEIQDYLGADGRVRRSSVMRAEVAITGKSRPLLFRSARLDQAMDAYLSQRNVVGESERREPGYRGLDPHARLFVSSTGTGFEITPYGAPGQRRFLCRGIQETYRKLFRYAGYKGMSALSARHTFADRLYARGADEFQVGQLLGIADPHAVRTLFQRRVKPLHVLTQELV
ncbi:site-specific integrase [Paucibacter sp. O1-1]|nr:site-specific integrase [Paucibacter sp. O1-1]MDA3825074.1 site-specific integrase [Paucibacter sp. O1-1]